MQDGEIIEDRILDDIVRSYASKRLVTLRSFSGDWVHHLTSDSGELWLSGYKTSLNNSAAGAIAQDKVATYELLTTHDIAAVPHYLYRRSLSEQSARALSNQRIVTKPLTGTSGRGIKLHDTLVDARLYMDQHPDSWAVSPYVEIHSETRVIVLDGKIILSFDKSGAVRHDDGLVLFNLSHGGTPQVRSLEDDESEIAVRAQSALGLSLCAVDIVSTPQGKFVLEVNDGFMLEHFMRVSEEYRQLGTEAYETIFDSHLFT